MDVKTVKIDLAKIEPPKTKKLSCLGDPNTMRIVSGSIDTVKLSLSK
ncbi:hypothetical protein [Halalkalibacterium halodurans]|nr:hypothetical protein [Halalkalibacterium halodurans]